LTVTEKELARSQVITEEFIVDKSKLQQKILELECQIFENNIQLESLKSVIHDNQSTVILLEKSRNYENSEVLRLSDDLANSRSMCVTQNDMLETFNCVFCCFLRRFCCLLVFSAVFLRNFWRVFAFG
jgi:chromosome segregation ATPase